MVCVLVNVARRINNHTQCFITNKKIKDVMMDDYFVPSVELVYLTDDN